jgi:hypothetical protein
MEPTVDEAPSVKTPAQFSEKRHFVSRYEAKKLNISCSFLFSGSSLQQKKLS